MNQLVGERISIATFKAQTTRHRIMGIVNTPDMQIVFSDTPGVLKPNYKLQESMLAFSESALTDADILLYVTDVVENPEKNMEFLEKVQKMQIPVILLINKIDELKASPSPSKGGDVELPQKGRRASSGKQTPPPSEGLGEVLTLHGCRGNNLKNIDVEFPLGKLIVVTGVSGSGKSTLINETLYPILSRHFYRSLQTPMPYDSIEGLEYIDKVVNVDQSPIGRTPRSNPATYTGVFSDIRSLFVNLPEAQIRGYKAGRFSFNVKGGRCEACGGNGYKTIEMNFLPNIQVPCEECHGKRYNRETLEVRFKGKSIADVLDMTINQAVEFFENVPDILRKIKTIQDVGLGYIKLGQPSTTLSGGESQRVKLATELSKRDTGRTLYILDEPTTGLHFEDIRILMDVLQRLVDRGNTVIVIEHNMDVIKQADWIIDMGPEGGRGGGTILTTGTPEEVAQSDKGYTPRFLRAELARENA